ncbi:LuxR C-terminal-related transcriptional regulator [Sinomonas sp. ASV486]|uniref:ATP-binding protein n=1 Tax=Sinomonas sp. ASV486 TaxID=3051170 RepID=UPI0027DDF7EA|nr:LuxR C-terminal-related transcriptional regulator [Sinomonas sp. ASV486]MDQ4491643.1 LuxR C-terminal-related transcriptional regulator [Sinomonas sp. ASV486]
MATRNTTSAAMTALAARIPVPASSFIGRAEELDALARARDATRVVTLVGPGGAGKTRILLESLRRDPPPPERIAFADLSGLPAGAPLAPAVAEAAGLRGITSTEAVAAVVWWLDLGGESIVVLDNAESMLGEAARLASELVEGTAAARILATSRRPLNVAGERVVSVGPMSAEDVEALFWERALAVRSSLPDSPASRASARELCERIDRLPLAIELAAARSLVMAPAELLAELERGIDALGEGPTTAPARHRSLRATIEGSVGALDGRGREVFEACGIFAGPFSARAAAVVAHASLGDLEDLVSRSLLQASSEPAGRTIFRMLGTLREYATESLAAAGRLDAVREAHLAWMVQELGGEGFPSVADRLRASHRDDALPDLRAALDFALRADPAAGLRLMASTEELWRLVAADEGAARVDAFLDAYRAPDEVRAGGLVAATCLSLVRQDAESMRTRSAEALDILDAHTEAAGAVEIFRAAGLAYAGEAERAEAAARRALEAFAAVGDEAGQARARGILSAAALFAGRAEEAVAGFASALELAAKAGDVWGQGQILTHWGMAEHALGRTASARAKLLAALDRFGVIGDVVVYGSALAQLAALDVRRAPAAAVRAAASAARRQGGSGRYDARTLADIAGVRTAAAALIGEGPARQAWDEGERITFADAAAGLRALDAGASRGGLLTARELEVAEMVRRGHTNASIARRLGISERTVESHVAHATAKLGIRNRVALAGWAADHPVGG